MQNDHKDVCLNLWLLPFTLSPGPQFFHACASSSSLSFFKNFNVPFFRKTFPKRLVYSVVAIVLGAMVAARYGFFKAIIFYRLIKN